MVRQLVRMNRDRRTNPTRAPRETDWPESTHFRVRAATDINGNRFIRTSRAASKTAGGRMRFPVGSIRNLVYPANPDNLSSKIFPNE